MRRGVLVIIVLLVIVGAVAFILSKRGTGATGQQAPGSGSVAAGSVPKPNPIATNFLGCPPSGDGGDPVLNTLKNRIDEATWSPTTVADILALTWPRNIEQKPRSRWSMQDKDTIAMHEGSPMQLEGYLVSVKKMGPETCNCHAVDYVDFHVWMVDDPAKDRAQSVVIEVTPRVSSFHPTWTLNRLQQIVRNHERVRVSGWLMMDPEHPDQIGKTRGTIWEVHPIMQIETRSLGQWSALDNGSTGIRSAQGAVDSLPVVTPLSTATAPPVSDKQVQDNQTVHITNIFADGTKGSNEPDEYVEISNTGSEPVDITDWELQDLTGSKEYKWESYVLQSGAKIRVYTNEVHPESGSFTFQSQRAIWRNSGDVAELYDLDKQLISRYAYGNQK